jgi:hypothetical protein
VAIDSFSTSAGRRPANGRSSMAAVRRKHGLRSPRRWPFVAAVASALYQNARVPPPTPPPDTPSDGTPSDGAGVVERDKAGAVTRSIVYSSGS